MSRTRLETAQWMAAKGMHVFIVNPRSKTPLSNASWYKRQSQKPEQIAAWFEETPDCNYGIHLGANYVVIDLDKKMFDDGVKAFEEICAENGIMDFKFDIDTFMVETPGGGYHLYFKSPFPVANKNKFPEGIDVRGTQGYVIGPGSRDTRGEWAVIDPDAEIADLPKWLEQYLVEPGYRDPNAHVPLIELDLEESIEDAKRWLEKRDPAVEGQGGDNWTYETAQFVRDFGISEALAPEVMEEWNNRCEPPWGPEELEAKIGNAYDYGQNRPGCKSSVYKVQRLEDIVLSRHTELTEEQMIELMYPMDKLAHEEHQYSDEDDVPDDVVDDEFDPETGRAVQTESVFKSWSDFTWSSVVREYVIYEWVLAHGVSHMVAKRGTGKSTVALDMALHIACDMDWAGQPTQKGWKVIYICGEDDIGMKLNARAWSEKHGCEPSEDRILFTEDIIKLTEWERLKLRVKEILKWAEGSRCIVFLDTWQRATAGWSKNDSREMEEAVRRAEWMARSLKGPMISLVHPPKDGRMTVRGAGEQEDTSYAIYHLTKETDSIKLEIDRMKGPGTGRWLKFNLKAVDLEFGEDAFGKRLNGLVAMKLGGSEDPSSAETADRYQREIQGWARALQGVNNFPLEDNDFEQLNTLNVGPVAQFIEKMAILASEKNEDGVYFRERYLSDLEPFLEEGLRSLTEYKIRKRLTELFDNPKKPIREARTNDGQCVVSYAVRSDRKRKGARKSQKTFLIEDVVI